MKKHHNNEKLSTACHSTASWGLNPRKNFIDYLKGRLDWGNGVNEGFRYFRLVQTGPNSSDNNILSIAGLEFYGILKEFPVIKKIDKSESSS